MTKADFHYEILNFSGRDVILIEDLNRGNMSVTNDIENVVDEIAEGENLDPKDYMIVYADSAGSWDGWDATTKEFVPLVQNNWQNAINTYIAKQLQSQ